MLDAFPLYGYIAPAWKRGKHNRWPETAREQRTSDIINLKRLEIEKFALLNIEETRNRLSDGMIEEYEHLLTFDIKVETNPNTRPVLRQILDERHASKRRRGTIVINNITELRDDISPSLIGMLDVIDANAIDVVALEYMGSWNKPGIGMLGIRTILTARNVCLRRTAKAITDYRAGKANGKCESDE